MKHTSALIAVLLASTGQAQTTHLLMVEDDEFNPSSLTITAGDHVHILWDNSVTNDHSFTQVDQAVWNANGDTPLPGGYDFGVGTLMPGTDFTITPTASVWYVCTFHASMGMKGTITVVGNIGIEEPTAQDRITLEPNPANALVTVIAPGDAPLMIQLFDATGREAMNSALNADRTIDIRAFVAGIYFMDIRTQEGTLLSRQHLVITR